MQEGEAARLQHILQQHGIDSIETVIAMAESFGTPEMPLRATTDAKYLEVGPTGKSDNVDALFARLALLPRIAASGAMSLLASRIPSSAVMPVC